jgi:hypothetical protein
MVEIQCEKNKGCVTHYGLAIYIKTVSILRQKKNYENSNIFHHSKNIPNLPKKNPLKESKILQDIKTLELISSFSTQAKTSSFKNSHIKK